MRIVEVLFPSFEEISFSSLISKEHISLHDDEVDVDVVFVVMVRPSRVDGFDTMDVDALDGGAETLRCEELVQFWFDQKMDLVETRAQHI